MTKRAFTLLMLPLLLAVACRFGAAATPEATPSDTPRPTLPAGMSDEPLLLMPDACPVQVPDAAAESSTEAEPGHIGLEDPYFPQLGNEGYDVLHYQIDLTVDLAAQTLAGTTTIDAVAVKALSGLNLEFLGMDIHSLSVDGQPADYSREGVELIVTLPQAVADGQTFQIAVEYSGTPGEGVDLSNMAEYSVGWDWYEEGAYVAAEPTGASSWFPVNEHPADKATYGYRITVAKPYVVAANGLLAETIDNGDSRTFVWNAQYPMASYLATVGVGHFDVETLPGPNGVVIHNYYEQDIVNGVRDDFARIGEIIEFYNGIFGDYPFEAAGVIVHDLDFNFSLETQTLIVFGFGFTDEFVVAHELAHQWYGDSVGLTCWQDIWLNEGFATYASSLWTEHAYGEQALTDELSLYYQEVAGAGGFAAPPGNPGAGDLFNFGVYYRGALTLHALRLEVGDEVFFNILRTYFERYEDKNATTADFIAVAEELSGQELNPLLDEWLYSTDIPDLPQMDLYREDYQ